MSRTVAVLYFSLCWVMVAFAAKESQFEPNHLFVNAQDEVSGEPAIFEFDEDGDFVRKIFFTPGDDGRGIGIAFGPDGCLYATAIDNEEVIKIDPELNLTTLLNNGDGLALPYGLSFGPCGTLFVANTDTSTVLTRETNGDTAFLDLSSFPEFHPLVVSFGLAGNLYFSSDEEGEIYEASNNCLFVRTFNDDVFDATLGNVVETAEGTIYVSSWSEDRIYVLDADGATLDTIDVDGGSFQGYLGLQIGPNGHLFVCATESGDVFELERDGTFVRTISHPDMQDPAFLAFAPFRYKCKIVASAGNRNGTFPKRVKERKFVLSVNPGSGLVMIDFSNRNLEGNGVAGLLGEPWLIFHGVENRTKNDHIRLIYATLVKKEALAAGMGSIQILLKGKNSDNGVPRSRNVKGNITLNGSSGTVTGLLRARVIKGK